MEELNWKMFEDYQPVTLENTTMLVYCFWCTHGSRRAIVLTTILELTACAGSAVW